MGETRPCKLARTACKPFLWPYRLFGMAMPRKNAPGPFCAVLGRLWGMSQTRTQKNLTGGCAHRANDPAILAPLPRQVASGASAVAAQTVARHSLTFAPVTGQLNTLKRGMLPIGNASPESKGLGVLSGKNSLQPQLAAGQRAAPIDPFAPDLRINAIVRCDGV